MIMSAFRCKKYETNLQISLKNTNLRFSKKIGEAWEGNWFSFRNL